MCGREPLASSRPHPTLCGGEPSLEVAEPSFGLGFRISESGLLLDKCPGHCSSFHSFMSRSELSGSVRRSFLAVLRLGRPPAGSINF